jgi:WD40 repeat protein
MEGAIMSALHRRWPTVCLLLLSTSLHAQAPDQKYDELPAGVVARFGSFRLRHPDRVQAIAFAPNGKTIFAAGADKVIRQWDLDSGKEIRKLEGHTEDVLALAVTSDGKKLFSTGMDRTVQEWDLTTGKSNELGKHDDGVESLALSSNGALLATVGRDFRIGLWGVPSGEHLCWLTGHENTIVCVAFSPDGKTLATGSLDETIRLWDVGTRKPGLILKGRHNPVSSLAFAPDGKTLASGNSGGNIRFWNLATGKEELKFDAGLNHVLDLVYTQDGKRLLAGGSPEPFRDVASSLRAFDPATGKLLWQRFAHLSVKLNGTTRIVLSPNGKTAATSGLDGRICLWDPVTGRDLRPVRGHQDVVTGVAFLSGERLWLTASLDGTMRWWESNGKEKRHIDIPPAHLMAVSPDGKRIVTSRAGQVTVHDATGVKLHEWPVEDGPIRCLALAPDGKALVTGAVKGKVALRRLDGTEMQKLSGLEEHVQSAVFSPDGKQVAAVTRNEAIQRWETSTGKPLPALAEGLRDVTCLAYSPEGHYLAAGFGGSRSIVLWDVRSGAKMIEFDEEGSLINALAFSPDGQTIFASHEDGKVRYWEVRTGKNRRAFSLHHEAVISLAASPDGRLLATASNDQTALLVNRWHSPHENAGPLTEQRLQEFWSDLASDDATRAYDAMCSMLTAPKRSLAFLQKRLVPLQKVDAVQVAKWIANLDARSFKAREEAMDNLARLGRLVEEPLKEAFEGKTSLDQKRRIEELLRRLTVTGPVEEWRRMERAIEIVEQVGGEQAIELLKKVADGGDFKPTREARAALERLQRR